MNERIIGILSLPIMILNIVSGIVGGIWLAVLGEWVLIAIGILYFLFSKWIINILMAPAVLIAEIAGHYYSKRKGFFANLFAFISQLYTNIIIATNCVFAFFICSRFYSGNIGVGYIPYLLWSWDMALGEWRVLSSRHPGGLTEFGVISATFFYFLFLTSIFISRVLPIIIVIIFGVVQLIVLPIFGTYVVYQTEKIRWDAV